MNRDAIIATCIGIIFGVCIAALVLVGPKIGSYISSIPKPSFSFSLPSFFSFTKKEEKPINPTNNPSAAITDITIDSPLPDTIISESEILISGKTIPNATVVATNQFGDWTTTSDSTGVYALTVTLSEGLNTLTLTSWNTDKEYSKQLSLYQTGAKLE
jgi:hypothetical protein